MSSIQCKNEEENMMINIAYCFDENLSKHACVVVSSLLLSNKEKNVHYNIFCICTAKAAEIRELMVNLVSEFDPMSKVTFISVNNAYDGAYEIRGISCATYMRFMLPGLLPNIEKIIYMDVDFIVNGSLSEIWRMNMSGICFAGVKAEVNLKSEWDWKLKNFSYWTMLEDWKGNYINAGFLLMNLKEIRNRNLVTVWNKLAERDFFYQDQDIINISCQGYYMDYNEQSGEMLVKKSIKFIPTKFNAMTFMDWTRYSQMILEGIYDENDVFEAIENPICIHYAGEKPWKDISVRYSFLWWEYVYRDERLQDLFKSELLSAIRKSGSANLDPRTVINNNTNAGNGTERANRNLANYLLLYEWIKLIQNGKSISDYFISRKIHRLAIYGMHYIGELLYKELTKNGIEVAFGIDKKISNIDDKLNIYKISDDMPDVEYIIVTPIFYFQDIKKELLPKVIGKIISLQEIIDELKDSER